MESPMKQNYFNSVVDSGKREDFDTGSRRDTREGKGRYDLISPIFLERFAKHLENGAAKYGDRNWELGQPVMRYFDSAVRHLYKWLEGHRDEDHLSAAAWNVQCIMHTLEMIERGLLPQELDDTPDGYLGFPIDLNPPPMKQDPDYGRGRIDIMEDLSKEIG